MNESDPKQEESEKDDYSYPKKRESDHGDETDPVMGDRVGETEAEKGESGKGNGTHPDKGVSDTEDKIDSKVPKYEVGTFVIKEVDNIWCTGAIYRSGLNMMSFVYFVHFTELDFEETIVEDDIAS